MRYPVYVNGDIPIKDLEDAIAPLGFHVRIDAGHRMVIDRIPLVVARQPAAEQTPAERLRRVQRVK